MIISPLSLTTLSILCLNPAPPSQERVSLAKLERREASPSVAFGGEARPVPGRVDAQEGPWMKRYLPKRNRLLLGAFGGIFLPSRNVELFKADPTVLGQGHKEFRRLNPEVGGRLSYKILKSLAIELEGMVSPAQTVSEQDSMFWAARSHVLAQIARWRISPFALAGAGAMAVRSQDDVVGDDLDFAVHAGVGFDIGLREHLRMRLDVRDVITAARGVKDGFANNLEANLGLSLAFDLSKPKEVREIVIPPKDSDGDGYIDSQDKCVRVPGVAPEGCPAPEPEVATPPPDTDQDGILDADDHCVKEPETVNGFEDSDGCPDELPKEVEKFSGVVKGIRFATGKSDIRSQSFKLLNKAVKIFAKYPSIRIEIQGHTDDRGKASYNQELSQARADSVREYLVAHGIEEERISSRGFGPDRPVADNDTRSGRAENRRIEFRIVQGDGVKAESD